MARRKSSENPASEALQRQVAALSEENKRLRRDLAGRQDQERLVEILNVNAGRVSLHNPDDPKQKIHLDGYGSGNERRTVPERYWAHWMTNKILAIQLGQLRIERYIFPENYPTPEPFRTLAYTPEEVQAFFKEPPKKFRARVDAISEPEIWKRWYNIGMDVYERGMKDPAIMEEYPQIGANLSFMEGIIVENQRKAHGYEEGAEDIITFTGEARLKEALRAGRIGRAVGV